MFKDARNSLSSEEDVPKPDDPPTVSVDGSEPPCELSSVDVPSASSVASGVLHLLAVMFVCHLRPVMSLLKAHLLPPHLLLVPGSTT